MTAQVKKVMDAFKPVADTIGAIGRACNKIQDALRPVMKFLVR
jgi:hypothetical protein